MEKLSYLSVSARTCANTLVGAFGITVKYYLLYFKAVCLTWLKVLAICEMKYKNEPNETNGRLSWRSTH